MVTQIGIGARDEPRWTIGVSTGWKRLRNPKIHQAPIVVDADAARTQRSSRVRAGYPVWSMEINAVIVGHHEFGRPHAQTSGLSRRRRAICRNSVDPVMGYASPLHQNLLRPVKIAAQQCYPINMGRLLDKLRNESCACRIVPEGEGVLLVAHKGLRDEFSDLVRDLVRTSGEDYVAFPTTDGHAGYERVFLLPLDPDS